MVVNELVVYRRVKNDCLCLVKRMMFNMLRNTPCGTRCLKKALDGSGGRVRETGQEGQVRRTGHEDVSVRQARRTGQEDRSGGQVRRDGSGGLVMRTCQ